MASLPMNKGGSLEMKFGTFTTPAFGSIGTVDTGLSEIHGFTLSSTQNIVIYPVVDSNTYRTFAYRNSSTTDKTLSITSGVQSRNDYLMFITDITGGVVSIEGDSFGQRTCNWVAW